MKKNTNKAVAVKETAVKKIVVTPEQTDKIVEGLVNVKLFMSSWLGIVKVPAMARKLEQTEQAKDGSTSVDVYLLPDDLKHELGTATTRINAAWKMATLPWEDGGWRVVPAAGFLPLMEMISPYVKAFNEVADKIASRYDEIEAEARKNLNGYFSSVRFPAKEQIRDKYNVFPDSRPIVRNAKIEGLSSAAQDDVDGSVARQRATQLKGAVEQMGEMLKELVADAHSRLTETEQKGTKYNGLQAKAKKLCTALRGLNIIGDPNVTAIIERIDKTITAYDAETLRETATARVETAVKVKTLSDELNVLFG